MNRKIKLIIPVAAAAAIIIIGSNIRTGGCSWHAPLALFGGIMGCSGQEEPSKPSESSQGRLDAAPVREKYTGPVKVTFVELGSVNCIPCKMMQPVMKQVEETFAGQVKVVFYDVWTSEGRPYGMKYGIRAIPTQVFLDAQGNEYFRHEGYFPFGEVEKILNKKGVE